MGGFSNIFEMFSRAMMARRKDKGGLAGKGEEADGRRRLLSPTEE